MTTETLLLTAVSTLTTVVGGLATAVGWLGRHLLRRADDCEQDRRRLWRELRKLRKGGEGDEPTVLRGPWPAGGRE